VETEIDLMSGEPNKQEPKALGRQRRNKFKALVVTVGVSAAGLFMLSSPLILLKQCLTGSRPGCGTPSQLAWRWIGLESSAREPARSAFSAYTNM
jgi:hypothetical protein